MRNVWVLVVLVACGKSEPDYKQANPPPAKPAKPAAEPGSAAAAPAEAAEVSGPTKSATGSIDLDGAIKGAFEWKKKDQHAPITCIWSPDKEIGTLKIDLSDGAGHIITIGLDIPPTEVGPGRLEVSAKDLPTPLKTYAGFKLKGDEADTFSAVFDGAVAVSDPDAQMNADKKKKAEPPPDPHVTLQGTLEVTCPKKK